MKKTKQGVCRRIAVFYTTKGTRCGVVIAPQKDIPSICEKLKGMSIEDAKAHPNVQMLPSD